MSLLQRAASLHARVRSEGRSPRGRAASYAVGAFLGCLPVYGLHLPLCILFARVFRLNAIRLYIGAHINNPLTAPLLLFAQIQIGSYLRRKEFYDISWRAVRGISLKSFALDLALGSVVVGALTGIVVFIAMRITAREHPEREEQRRQFERIALRYVGGGIAHWEFVRGKLRHDPMFEQILVGELIPSSGTLLDVGCGRGILLALLADTRPDSALTMIGIEPRTNLVEVAREALHDTAEIVEGDAQSSAWPEADTIALLDVMHYVPAADQEEIAAKIARHLNPGGQLLFRDADANAGWGFSWVRFGERVMSILRGEPRRAFHYRSLEQWDALFAEHGFVRHETTGKPGAANRLSVYRRA